MHRSIEPAIHYRGTPVVVVSTSFSLGQSAGSSRLARGPEDAYAPWKQRGLKGVAGKALASYWRRKYTR